MTLRSRIRALAADERGSILPLAVGFVVLVAALIGVTVDLTSLYLAQKQVDAVADAAALAGADGFTFEVLPDGRPAATLDAEGVRVQAAAVVAANGDAFALAGATTPDARTAEVTVSLVWHPPLSSVFVPDGVFLESTASSRTALN